MRVLLSHEWGRHDHTRRWWDVTVWFEPSSWLLGLGCREHLIEHEVDIHLPMLHVQIWHQDAMGPLRSVSEEGAA